MIPNKIGIWWSGFRNIYEVCVGFTLDKNGDPDPDMVVINRIAYQKEPEINKEDLLDAIGPCYLWGDDWTFVREFTDFEKFLISEWLIKNEAIE